MKPMTFFKTLLTIILLFSVMLFWGVIHDLNIVMLDNGADGGIRATTCTMLFLMSCVITGLFMFVLWGKEKKRYVREKLPIKDAFRG